MKISKESLAEQFVCAKCRNHSCHVEEVSMPTGALSRVLPVRTGRYLAASCALCGYTEFYNMVCAVESEEAAPSASKIEPEAEGA